MSSCQGKGGTGTLYSYAQLMGLWINNGGSPVVAPVAAAIAEAESGGCTAAQNPTDNGGAQTSWGLWQISNGTHAMPAANIYDANVNARQAVAKYKSAGNAFTPWGTYNSGAYQRYLSPGTTPDTSIAGGSGTATATLTASAGAAPGDCAFSLGGQHIGILFGHGPSLPSLCLVTKGEMRALLGASLITAGAIPMLLGAVILAAFAFRGSGGQQAATQAVTAVTPIGRAARAGTRTARQASAPARGRHAKQGSAPARGRHARTSP